MNVYETTLPLLSETTRWVVDWRGWLTVALACGGFDGSPWLSYGLPGATGLVAACVSSISARRSAAKLSDRRPVSGTSKKSGSAR